MDEDQTLQRTLLHKSNLHAGHSSRDSQIYGGGGGCGGWQLELETKLCEVPQCPENVPSKLFLLLQLKVPTSAFTIKLIKLN